MASHSGCRRAESPDTANFASFLCFLLVRLLEKSGGSKKPLEGRDSSQPKFDLLTDNGNWRLIFTTGDVKTQKKLGGKISYVPIKAVQVCLSLYVCVLWWCRSVYAAGSPAQVWKITHKKTIRGRVAREIPTGARTRVLLPYCTLHMHDFSARVKTVSAVVCAFRPTFFTLMVRSSPRPTGIQPGLHHHERCLLGVLPRPQVHWHLHMGGGERSPRVHLRPGKIGISSRIGVVDTPAQRRASETEQKR